MSKNLRCKANKIEDEYRVQWEDFPDELKTRIGQQDKCRPLNVRKPFVTD